MSSKTQVLSNSQENILHFLNTHLAMVALLMPWKKVGITPTGEPEQVVLFTLLDFVHTDKEDWVVRDTAPMYDETLVDKSNALIGVTSAMLVFTILGFVGSVVYPNKGTERFGIDAISLIMGVVTLALALSFQGDFDAKWAHDNKVNGMQGPVIDYDQMFLVVGVLVGQIVISLALMSDKLKEVISKIL